MKRFGPIVAFNRREFLKSAAALPVLTCVSPQAAFCAGPAPKAPYLAFEKYIAPGSDEFSSEKTASEIHNALTRGFQTRQLPLAASCKGSSPCPISYTGVGPDLTEAVFDRSDTNLSRGWSQWISILGHFTAIRFYVLPANIVRYEVTTEHNGRLLYRVGLWKQVWQNGRIVEFSPIEEYVAGARDPWFVDVTTAVLAAAPEAADQLVRGVPYWRARLDPASGIDVYGSNGIAVGDIDNDGGDEVYVCQPGGLPNRLLKFTSGCSVEDIAQKWAVNLLDDTSCALFLDLRNIGRQDLVVLRSSGPVLFLNEGDHFRLRTDAFRVSTPPRGGFTGMAAADFDRDGKLDLYLCCYVYFQSEAQYTYASPYHDARNGPPNFLFRNNLNQDGSGFFDDCTQETGMNENNDRFSFAPAWCDYNGDGWPDLYVANDFGRKNLYQNQNGHFHDVAARAGVEDIGPGMSASWFDCDHDGRPDLYVANMWTDAGQRLTHDPHFEPAKQQPEAYRGHTMGNSLFRNRGDGTFEDTTALQHVAFGRWAWSSGGHDLDNDGNAEIFITCGMLTNTSTHDLNSFFWRQVVSSSSMTEMPSQAYQDGWNAINQFLREDYSWNGREPNVLHVKRGDRYFDFSGVSGLDFADDSRAFAITDFDGDGRPDLILKSRLGPQVRFLQNNCAGSNHSIAFRLRGTKSNRDAIGARVQVDHQTKWLDAGSGFLSQHSKQLIFGLATADRVTTVRITWPSGLVQEFSNLQAGRTYTVVEGSAELRTTPFRAPRALPYGAPPGDNRLLLQDTWFLEAVPIPTAQQGPGLFVVKDATDEYDVFRRYLFDWRAPLEPPLPLLLNGKGEAVKVYGKIPSLEQVRADLAELQKPLQTLALPFAGFYVKAPKRDFFKFAAAFLWAGYPDKALPYLEEVLHQTPDNARVLTLLGQIHFEAGRLNEAETSYRQAAQIDPSTLNAWLGLGDIAAKRDQQRNAANFFAKALELDPKSAEAANGLGLALAKQGNLEDARRYFEQAITARRDYSDAINNLAVLYTQQGKINDAIEAWSYGIRVAPDEDILYLNLGRTYVRMGQNEKARLIMQQLLDRKPDDATARRALQDLNGR